MNIFLLKVFLFLLSLISDQERRKNRIIILFYVIPLEKNINFSSIPEIFKFWEIPPREMFWRALIGQAPRMSHRVTHEPQRGSILKKRNFGTHNSYDNHRNFNL